MINQKRNKFDSFGGGKVKLSEAMHSIKEYNSRLRPAF